MYALPKIKNKSRDTLTEEEEKKMTFNIYTEIEDMRKRKFSQIKNWKCKVVKRKYAFEMPLSHGEHMFLKIKYDATMPPLPNNL